MVFKAANAFVRRSVGSQTAIDPVPPALEPLLKLKKLYYKDIVINFDQIQLNEPVIC